MPGRQGAKPRDDGAVGQESRAYATSLLRCRGEQTGTVEATKLEVGYALTTMTPTPTQAAALDIAW